LRTAGIGDETTIFPVVDLSAEFADLTAEIEAHPPKCLERGRPVL
jgi:hypothetical protein